MLLKKTIMARMVPHFHDLHVLAESLEYAKLELIHSCQLD